jgi:hypothetical protein
VRRESILEGKVLSEAAVKKNGRKFASSVLYAGCALALFLVTSSVARAQDTAAAPPPPPVPPDAVYVGMGHGPMPPEAIEFVGFQAGLSDKVVTGAPFSATITTESKQTLADGNEIQHTSSGSLARDSQGRTRRDMTLPAFGPWSESGKPAPHVASVNDPVAKASYLLDTDDKTARVMQVRAGQRIALKGQWEGGEGKGAADSETVTASLGTQVVGGVSAAGTRYTRTIPAGQIGNTKPIVVVTERWYSPELQMVVMTKRTDPRMGETTFEMTNIQRQEPAASLFQVPADYTVTQGGPHGGRHTEVLLAPPPVEQ